MSGESQTFAQELFLLSKSSNFFHVKCAIPKGLKHSIIYDFGVVVQSNDLNKVKHFYCLANAACVSTKNKYKMSHGCTSGPTDHLLSRHGIRAQKSIMADNTRAELQGSYNECYVGH